MIASKRMLRPTLIKGTEPYEIPEDRREYHVDRAFWLTTKVETGAKFGMVQAYDGCGMTVGLDQHIAVYPKELDEEDGNAADDQGSLWKLLRRMEYVRGNTGYQSRIGQLWKKLESQGWYLGHDGVLRYLWGGPGSRETGGIVFGDTIREGMTPHWGNVGQIPVYRKTAQEWAICFHLVFSHPDGFQAQVEYGKEHLVKRTRRRKIEWAYPGQEITALTVGELTWWDDLAMCMYQSHSVNAPAVANKCLKKAKLISGGIDPEKLIRLLGTSSYSRWDDDLKHGRYQRTRSAARASGLWPKHLFDGKDAIMPKDLVE